MNTRTRRPVRKSPLRWIFQRGTDRIVCNVDEARACTVSLTGEGLPPQTVRETFDDWLQAFHRHAEIAAHLRETGWTVASYSR